MNLRIRRTALASMLFLLTLHGRAQELVPNPGFEELIICPTGHSQLHATAYWTGPNNNQQGTPDYFHACAGGGTHSTPQNATGYQEPADGEGYAGIYLYEGSQVLANWREYVQVELLEELEAGRCYYFSVHASLADISSRTTNALGVRFYAQEVQLDNPYPPGDEPHLELPLGTVLNSTEWIRLEGPYEAQGGERFLMIGNYRDNANTQVQVLHTNGSQAYALIDKVSLTPCLTTAVEQMEPQVVLQGGHAYLRGVPHDESFYIHDMSGRSLAQGTLSGHQLALPQNVRGLLVLSIVDREKVWNYRIVLP